MDAQRSSALMEWSAWMSLLQAWGQSVELALLDTQEMHRSAMVSLKHFSYGNWQRVASIPGHLPAFQYCIQKS